MILHSHGWLACALPRPRPNLTPSFLSNLATTRLNTWTVVKLPPNPSPVPSTKGSPKSPAKQGCSQICSAHHRQRQPCTSASCLRNATAPLRRILKLLNHSPRHIRKSCNQSRGSCTKVTQQLTRRGVGSACAAPRWSTYSSYKPSSSPSSHTKDTNSNKQYILKTLHHSYTRDTPPLTSKDTPPHTCAISERSTHRGGLSVEL